jgi:hypothetical protein
MAVKKEPVVIVEFAPRQFVYLNYYQVSTVIVGKNELEEITEVQFTMTNSSSWNFKNDIAADAYRQYLRLVNKEND